MQYDLFQDDDVEALHIEIYNLKKSVANLRRGLFARHNELERLIKQVDSQIHEVKQITINKKAEFVPFFGELLEVSN